MAVIEKSKEEVFIISKSGVRTVMPNLPFAKDRATGLWKGNVERIEVKTTYKIEEE